MNQSLLLHVVERLEGLVGKLPGTIQKPILHELTPLKELFLQQRPPRFLLSGSTKTPLAKIVSTLFAPVSAGQKPELSAESSRWQTLNVVEHGSLSILDARDAGKSDADEIREELKGQPADLIFFLDENDSTRGPRKADLENLLACVDWNEQAAARSKVIGIEFATRKSAGRNHQSSDGDSGQHEQRLQKAFASKSAIADRLLRAFSFSSASSSEARAQLLPLLTQTLPNETRIEMIRISRDREAQREVAQILVKSTTAICTAIGAQPIPLADLPILTTLQLVMVSGIMYVSGRERSLRAATEFVGALGANVGLGMLLREGTRAILKFFPGWGNLVCGMVAGAGTYAIGRAATVFFLEGVSLQEARRTYLTGRKNLPRPALPGRKKPKKESARSK